MEVSDNLCNLECVTDKNNVQEFVGPVKIIFVKPSRCEHWKTQWNAALVALASMLLGTTFVIVFMFTLFFTMSYYNNLHVFLCTLGGQFAMPQAILMLNNRFGPAAPLRKPERITQHFLLQILAMLSLISGTLIILVYEYNIFGKSKLTSWSSHMISGCCCSFMPILVGIMGSFLYLKKSEQNKSNFITVGHRILGCITLLSSSICFVTGVNKPIIYLWGGQHLPMVLSIFCAFYTFIIMATPISRGKNDC